MNNTLTLHISYIFSFVQFTAVFTAFWLLIIRSSCVHGLGPRGQIVGVTLSALVHICKLYLDLHIPIFSYFLLSVLHQHAVCSMSSIPASLGCYQEAVFLMVPSIFYRWCPLSVFSTHIACLLRVFPIPLRLSLGKTLWFQTKSGVILAVHRVPCVSFLFPAFNFRGYQTSDWWWWDTCQ